MGGGVELLCLYGSVTGKAESIATQVAKGSFPHALKCWRMCLRIKEEYVDLLLCCLGCGQGPTTWLGLFSVLLRRGGSSKYSREALEDRSGEGFRVNSRWTRVSRS